VLLAAETIWPVAAIAASPAAAPQPATATAA
jgi:hypothetical protein